VAVALDESNDAAKSSSCEVEESKISINDANDLLGFGRFQYQKLCATGLSYAADGMQSIGRRPTCIQVLAAVVITLASFEMSTMTKNLGQYLELAVYAGNNKYRNSRDGAQFLHFFARFGAIFCPHLVQNNSSLKSVRTLFRIIHL
jgi:hypothetical protein